VTLFRIVQIIGKMEGPGARAEGSRTGGVYIPPFKLAQLRKSQKDQSQFSEEGQRLSWEALRKSINGLINKVNISNIKNIIPELFQENLIRGRGLFARAIMKAQLASPGFTHIYAALVAVVNTKLPEIGELVLKRVIFSFKRAYKRRDKIVATGLAKFIAHLVNHQVAHELLALQLLTVLLEDPTDDSVEIAVNFVKEVGQILDELSPQGLHAIFERFRGILHEGDIDKRVQYTIEALFAVRKSGFKDYPAIPKELDLVEKEDQITFDLGLDDDIDKEEMLDIFRFDQQFEENENLWTEIKKEILGDDEEERDEEAGEGFEDEAEGAPDQATAGSGQIRDLSEQDLVNLRRTIYLTIMSAVSFEECSHKLAKLNIPDNHVSELANMLVECCSNEKSFQRYYGLMGQRFCMMHRKYQDSFDEVFMNQYSTIHRLETNKLRNVAKFFAHLLSTDALPWTCFAYIRLNETETTSSSRIFIKILVQELVEALGLAQVRTRFQDPTMAEVFSGLFPTDNARDTRFAINFFTSIGLGGLTDALREHLKNAPKLLAAQMQAQMQKQLEMQKLQQLKNKSDDSASSSSSDSDSDSSSSSDSDSDSSDSSDSSSSSDSDSDSRGSRSSSSGSSSTSDSDSDSNSSSDSSSESEDDSVRRRRTTDLKAGSSHSREVDKSKKYAGRSGRDMPADRLAAQDHREDDNGNGKRNRNDGDRGDKEDRSKRDRTSSDARDRADRRSRSRSNDRDSRDRLGRAGRASSSSHGYRGSGDTRNIASDDRREKSNDRDDYRRDRRQGRDGDRDRYGFDNERSRREERDIGSSDSKKQRRVSPGR
jgi:pre-mRNA-splicing factor CWC22